jgi:predicted nucleotidyltransferase component of viral defense system
LSVDLDLVFRDHTLPRPQALSIINESVRQAAERMTARGFQVQTSTSAEAGETKLLVRRGLIEVKVKVNFVTRGTIHPVMAAQLTPKASEVLLADLEVPVVSLEDLYGGKLAAAMDRQHPRDLFDVMQLLSTKESHRAFGTRSSYTSQATTVRFTKCSSQPRETSRTSMTGTSVA